MTTLTREHVEQEHDRSCGHCGGPMSKRNGETRGEYAARRYCGRSCATRGRDTAAALARGRTKRTDDAARLEDLDWLLETGESVERIPGRLGLEADSLRTWLRRIGRRDVLARLVERAELEPYAPEALTRGGGLTRATTPTRASAA